MIPKKFVSSVQYGDFKGTVKADRADKKDAYDWLESKGYIDENEFILGMSINIKENPGKKDLADVDIFLTEPRDADTVQSMLNTSPDPINLRKVSIEMKIEEFFGFFKRFGIVLSPYGMLQNKEYTLFD